MLFDLQSPKRKRVVQVVFGAMAVLFAVSFVFLGIGTGLSGSPLEAIGIGGEDSADEVLDDDISEQEDILATNPRDTAALIEILNLRYQAANTRYEVDEETGQTIFTSEAEEQLSLAADAWDNYLDGRHQEPRSLRGAHRGAGLHGPRPGPVQRGHGRQRPGRARHRRGRAHQLHAGRRRPSRSSPPRARPSRACRPPSSSTWAASPRRRLSRERRRSPRRRRSSARALQKRLDAAEKQGAQINDQIDAYRKQLAKATPGADQGSLGDAGGGALGGGGGLGGSSLSTP